MVALLAYAYLAAGVVIAFMVIAILFRAHDGNPTGRAELAEEVTSDTGYLPRGRWHHRGRHRSRHGRN